MDAKLVRKTLLRWYKREGRDLPWRNTTDPYKIFLSELMLQQTQVSRGLIYFDQFTKKFPSWEDLAKASRAEVLKAWSGLGYNRRAIFIHEAAKQIVAQGVPDSYEGWLKVKGVGKYTAAALTVFSLRTRAYPVDTNIRRVIGRVFMNKPFADLKDDVAVQKHMVELMAPKPFHDIPQALFDVSTAYCQPNPACLGCPLFNICPMGAKFVRGEIKIEKQKKSKEKIRAGKKQPDRIYRGRILSLVKQQEKIAIKDIGPKIDPKYTPADLEWITSMVKRMETDGLITRRGRYILLAH